MHSDQRDHHVSRILFTIRTDPNCDPTTSCSLRLQADDFAVLGRGRRIAVTVTVTNSTLFYALRHSSKCPTTPPPLQHPSSTHWTGLGPIRPQCHTTTLKSRQAHKFILYAKQMDPRRQKFLRASRRRIANNGLGVTGLLREADGQLEGCSFQTTSKSSDAAGP